jgi:BirA family biotin operon repressor/biotin-[acetyl-CoA-carboxylase] ligase
VEALRAAGVEVEARAGSGYALARPLQLLDADDLRARLPADARAELASLEVAFETGSTNADALRAPLPA